ncbi:DUF4168 domain-containing protein [Aphanothece sacrum]|uniref:DUF4168 domain-containing protein n=1 Tax=Aphanothece sacrum FPU1 TaxID=1920663 RepID=A0A401IJ23_APHSA|nr:DUF4168 domain-containing protein [Aphanothece sacrum]GBF81287.1 hypothetical protein AsFPU1_2699 [Aphanothece sacrum FPU1]GBF83363.1 hypothetical protein AsFPU3_0405 [Aphanothece sacrum FPU3]
MFKKLFWRGFVGAIFPIFLLGGLPAYSQTQPLLAQANSQTNSLKSLSKEDLQKFAQAVKKLQALEEDAQRKMAEAVKAQGMTPERFMEIGKSENPTSSNINAAEQEKFTKALAQVKKIIEEDKVKKQEAVQTSGLNIDQFNEMAQAIRKDPALQEQVRKLLGS